MTARIRGPLGAACLVALTFAISPPGTAAADTMNTSAVHTSAFGVSTPPSVQPQQGQGSANDVFPTGWVLLLIAAAGTLAFGISQRRKQSD